MPSEALTPRRSSVNPLRAKPSHAAGRQYELRHQDAGRRWESHYIDSRAVRTHISRLRLAGIGIKQIAKLCGMPPGTIQILADRRTGPTVKVLPATAAKILAIAIPTTVRITPIGGQHVSAIGTTRRLRALVAAGYPPAMVSREIGLAPCNLYALFSHCDDVPAPIAQAVADLFDRWEMTRGPSDRARALAHKLGWAPPLAWDIGTIDAADAHPAPSAAKHVSFPERYRELRELGVCDELDIARRLGMQVDSLQRQLARYREDIAV